MPRRGSEEGEQIYHDVYNTTPTSSGVRELISQICSGHLLQCHAARPGRRRGPRPPEPPGAAGRWAWKRRAARSKACRAGLARGVAAAVPLRLALPVLSTAALHDYCSVCCAGLLCRLFRPNAAQPPLHSLCKGLDGRVGAAGRSRCPFQRLPPILGQVRGQRRVVVLWGKTVGQRERRRRVDRCLRTVQQVRFALMASGFPPAAAETQPHW